MELRALTCCGISHRRAARVSRPDDAGSDFRNAREDGFDGRESGCAYAALRARARDLISCARRITFDA